MRGSAKATAVGSAKRKFSGDVFEVKKPRRARGENSADFPALLDRFMSDGVRPSLSDRRGEVWSQKELGKACGGITDRQVRSWLDGSHLPQEIDTLERAFFGSDQGYQNELRHQFRTAFASAKAKRQNRSAYANLSTVVALWHEVKNRVDLRLRESEDLYADNVKQIAWLVSQLGGTLSESEALFHANAARAAVFDVKYGDWTLEKDERSVFGISSWTEEFSKILSDQGVNIDSKVVAVGIGPGLEGVGIYDRFADFCGIDISKNAIKRASLVFPNSRIIEGTAESLPQNIRDFDCYISLKTFSSSFFDIDSAIRQSAQVLRSGGLFICSIPKGYGYENGDFIPGISRTNYRYIDREDFITYSYPDRLLPFDLISRISDCLYRRLFRGIIVKTGLTEHYIIAKRK